MTLQHKKAKPGNLPVTVVATSVMATLASTRPKAMLGGVVAINREYSKTGLYIVYEVAVRPFDGGEGKTNKVMARAKGLTSEQERDLREQNVEIMFVRECPGHNSIVGVETERETREAAIALDTIFSTFVVPYLVLNSEQARSIRGWPQQGAALRKRRATTPSPPWWEKSGSIFKNPSFIIML